MLSKETTIITLNCDTMHARSSHQRIGLIALLSVLLLALPGTVSAGDLFTQERENQTYAIGIYTDIFAIEESRNGTLILGGYTSVQNTDDRAFLIRTGSDLGVEWHDLYPGSRIVALQELDDGRIISASLDEWVHPDSPTAAITGSGYLQMTEDDGTLIWREELPGDAPASIIIDDDAIILVGWTWPPAGDPEAVSGFFSRYDLTGALLERTEYPDVAVHDILETGGGGYLITGNTGDPGTAVAVQYGHLTKISADGEIEWRETYEGCSLFAITKMNDGYLLAGGTMPYGFQEGQALALGVTPDGKLLWEEKLQGYAAYRVAPYGDEFLIAGATGPGNPLIVTIRSDGSVTYSKRLLEAEGRFTAVAPLSDGSVAVGGWSRHTGSVEGWLLVFDPTIVPQEPEPAEAAGFTLITAALGLSGAAVWLRRREGR